MTTPRRHLTRVETARLLVPALEGRGAIWHVLDAEGRFRLDLGLAATTEREAALFAAVVLDLRAEIRATLRGLLVVH